MFMAITDTDATLRPFLQHLQEHNMAKTLLMKRNVESKGSLCQSTFHDNGKSGFMEPEVSNFSYPLKASPVFVLL